MQGMLVVWLVVGCAAGAAAVWLAARGRLEELRKANSEARERENAAEARAKKSEDRHAEVVGELKVALEEKGRYQNEATRVEEAKSALLDRDLQIKSLNDRITDLERDKATAISEADAANRRADDMVAKEREAQQAIVRAKDEQIVELSKFIDQAKGALTDEFKALSADVLKDASKQLVETADGIIKGHGQAAAADVLLHQKHIETMLKPVEENLKRLDKHVGDNNVARAAAEALLDEQIKRLAGASESLSSALRKPVVRGSWGEMTLENALENAGLKNEIDFILQHSTDAEDGRRRTDAIINLPKGRKLIIDSKNLMETYIPFANADNADQKAIFGQIHAKSLRGHIRDLSSKEYQKRYDTPDCVILFIPHDGMYHAAIQDEAELIREACEKRVFISNPMSLIPLLKAVAYVLDQERGNKSAEAIKDVGEKLYADLTRFAVSMANIGDKIGASVQAYNDAIPGLDRFIVSKSRRLKQLGAGKGAEAELPEAIEHEPRPFSSRELRTSNLFLQPSDAGMDIAALAGVEELEGRD
jgi:DNA recombination protein RmuC